MRFQNEEIRFGVNDSFLLDRLADGNAGCFALAGRRKRLETFFSRTTHQNKRQQVQTLNLSNLLYLQSIPTSHSGKLPCIHLHTRNTVNTVNTVHE